MTIVQIIKSCYFSIVRRRCLEEDWGMALLHLCNDEAEEITSLPLDEEVYTLIFTNGGFSVLVFRQVIEKSFIML